MKKLKLFSKTFIFLIIIFLGLTIIYSLSFNVSDADRTSKINVTSNESAFLSLQYESEYVISNNENIKFILKNNFDNIINISLNLQGQPISDFEPRNFSLLQNENEDIIVKIKNEIPPGIYDVIGNIYASNNYETVFENIEFKVIVED